jgi:hypothetical protein
MRRLCGTFAALCAVNVVPIRRSGSWVASQTIAYVADINAFLVDLCTPMG